MVHRTQVDVVHRMHQSGDCAGRSSEATCGRHGVASPADETATPRPQHGSRRVDAPGRPLVPTAARRASGAPACCQPPRCGSRSCCVETKLEDSPMWRVHSHLHSPLPCLDGRPAGPGTIYRSPPAVRPVRGRTGRDRHGCAHGEPFVQVRPARIPPSRPVHPPGVICLGDGVPPGHSGRPGRVGNFGAWSGDVSMLRCSTLRPASQMQGRTPRRSSRRLSPGQIACRFSVADIRFPIGGVDRRGEPGDLPACASMRSDTAPLTVSSGAAPCRSRG